jgi:hypothetical protein
MKLLFLIAFLSTLAPDAASAQDSIFSMDDRRALKGLGSCVGACGRVDLDRVMFLANKAILIDGPTGPLRVSLEREDLLIKELGGSSPQREYFNNVGYQVDQDDDLDVELKLARVDGKLAVYWRETYKNRIYRQGLFAIDLEQLFRATDKVLTPICHGRGGSHSEQ